MAKPKKHDGLTEKDRQKALMQIASQPGGDECCGNLGQGPMPKQHNTYDPTDIPDDLKDRPIYHALGKIAYQEHYSGNVSAGYVVFGRVKGTSERYDTLNLELIAEGYKPKVIAAIQKREHCRKNVSFLAADGGPVSLDMVKLLEVILK